MRLLYDPDSTEGKTVGEVNRLQHSPSSVTESLSRITGLWRFAKLSKYAYVLGRLEGPDFHLKSVTGPVFGFVFFLEKLHPVHLKLVGGWGRFLLLLLVCFLN